MSVNVPLLTKVYIYVVYYDIKQTDRRRRQTYRIFLVLENIDLDLAMLRICRWSPSSEAHCSNSVTDAT